MHRSMYARTHQWEDNRSAAHRFGIELRKRMKEGVGRCFWQSSLEWCLPSHNAYSHMKRLRTGTRRNTSSGEVRVKACLMGG